LADRDLVFQDFSLVLVPGTRLYSFPRARRERAALRLHLICEQRRIAPLNRAGDALALWPRPALASRGVVRRGPQTLVQAKRSTLRAGRAEDSSVECPELKRAKSLGRKDHDLPIRWRTYENRPNGRVLSKGFSAGGPAPTVRACANESLKPRAAGAARPLQRRAPRSAQAARLLPNPTAERRNLRPFEVLARTDQVIREASGQGLDLGEGQHEPPERELVE